MKSFLRVFAAILLLILLISSCSTLNSSYQDAQPSPTWVVTQNEYLVALDRWQSHKLSNYEITVDVFSSMLAPPCSTKGTLVVQDNKLVSTIEIVTPMPIQMPSGDVTFNPECYVYENYLVTKQFEVVENLLTGKLPSNKWNVKFDAEYGFVTELTYTTGGESAKIVRYSGFQPK